VLITEISKVKTAILSWTDGFYLFVYIQLLHLLLILLNIFLSTQGSPKISN